MLLKIFVLEVQTVVNLDSLARRMCYSNFGRPRKWRLIRLSEQLVLEVLPQSSSSTLRCPRGSRGRARSFRPRNRSHRGCADARLQPSGHSPPAPHGGRWLLAGLVEERELGLCR